MKKQLINEPATGPTAAVSDRNLFSEAITPPVVEGIDQIKPAAEEVTPTTNDSVAPLADVPGDEAQGGEAIATPVRHAALDGPIVNVPLADLKPHPLSVATYGLGCSDELMESIRRNGILQPLLVARYTMEILAGNSRGEAARQVGMLEVPVTYFDSADPLEIEAAVLETNKQRVKTEEQKIREFNAWKRIEAERAKLRMATNTGEQGMKKSSDAEKGTARDKAAEKIDMSGVTADKGSAVLAAIDVLNKSGETDQANELRTKLNEGSIEAAYKKAKAWGLITSKKKAKSAGVAQSSKKTAKGASKQNAGGKEGTTTAAAPNPELDEAHQKATAHADDVIKFLKTKGAANLATAQKKEWEKIGSQIVQCLKTLGLKAA